MRIVLIKDHQKKILDQQISPVEKSFGVISIEKMKQGTEFTIRLLDVNHIRYHYDPETQRFEVDFLSLQKKQDKNGKDKNHGNHEKNETRF